MAMFARVTRSEARPQDVDARTRYDEGTLIPALKKIAGFKGAYMLIDRNTGRGLTMTLWDSETAMKASEDAVAQLRSSGVQTVGVKITGVERYEVLTQA